MKLRRSITASGAPFQIQGFILSKERNSDDFMQNKKNSRTWSCEIDFIFLKTLFIIRRSHPGTEKVSLMVVDYLAISGNCLNHRWFQEVNDSRSRDPQTQNFGFGAARFIHPWTVGEI